MTAAQDFDITFGDCDPAGIVFYPNAFRWMDAGFHTLLRPVGVRDPLPKPESCGGGFGRCLC